MTYTTTNGTVIPLDFPGNKKYAALLHACRGRTELVPLLDYCVYGAALEIKNKKLNPECCNVVKLKRKHEDILTTIPNPPSRKTLIQYFKTLNEWGLVLSAKYHRDLGVNFQDIQTAINEPQPAGGYTKNVVSSSTTLQHSDDERLNVVMREMERLQHYNIELEKNVVMLAQNVVDLSAKVEALSKNVEATTTLQHSLTPHQERVQSHFFDPTISITTVLPSITEVYDGELHAQHRRPLDQMDQFVLSLQRMGSLTTFPLTQREHTSSLEETFSSWEDDNDAGDIPVPPRTSIGQMTPLSSEEMELTGELVAGYVLTQPLTISIVQEGDYWLVSESCYSNHATAPTRDEAIASFKAELVDELHALTHDESCLAPRLTAQLAYWRAMIREENAPDPVGDAPSLRASEPLEQVPAKQASLSTASTQLSTNQASDVDKSEHNDALGCDSTQDYPTTQPKPNRGSLASTRRHSEAPTQDSIPASQPANSSTNSRQPNDDTQADKLSYSQHPDENTKTPMQDTQDMPAPLPVVTSHVVSDGPAQSTLFPGEQSSKVEAGKGKGKRAATREGKPPKTEKPAVPVPTDEGKGKSRSTLPPEEEKLRKEVLAWVNSKRGFKLYGRAPAGEVTNEYNCVHSLAHMLYVGLHQHNMEDGCDWEDLEATWTHTWNEKYWKLHRERIGGFAILQQIATVISKRRKAIKKPASTPAQSASEQMRGETSSLASSQIVSAAEEEMIRQANAILAEMNTKGVQHGKTAA